MVTKTPALHVLRPVTPGPWTVGAGDPDDADSSTTDIFANGEMIGSAYEILRVGGDPCANAQLFAAAIDMYEALEAIVKFERETSEHLDTLIEVPIGPSPWIAKAEAALAKARGGQ